MNYPRPTFHIHLMKVLLWHHTVRKSINHVQCKKKEIPCLWPWSLKDICWYLNLWYSVSSSTEITGTTSLTKNLDNWVRQACTLLSLPTVNKANLWTSLCRVKVLNCTSLQEGTFLYDLYAAPGSTELRLPLRQ